MKSTAEELIGEDVVEAVITVPATSMTPSVRLRKMRVASRFDVKTVINELRQRLAYGLDSPRRVAVYTLVAAPLIFDSRVV